MAKPGFDNRKYIELQSGQIRKRIEEFGGKLYLEFGGKLFDDYHASRVLPGFEPDSKLQMLKNIGTDVEIVIAVNSSDIESNKTRGDLGITYGSDVLRLIDAFRETGLFVGSVVLTKFDCQPAAVAFKARLEHLGMRVFLYYPIDDYPFNTAIAVSEDGFGKNEYIETTRPLVVVTAPGPGSGKMATCLSQLYHEFKRGTVAGYAKFETFPIWNLPLKHPVNLAYEAATADLQDVNMIDPYHLEAYEKTAVNYNRDVEVFPVLSAIFQKISGACPYQSPTDMGVNMAGFCISDDEACRKASEQEIIRRYFTIICERKKGLCQPEVFNKIEIVMKQAGLTADGRPVVKAALDCSAATQNSPAVAIELPDGEIVTGKTSDELGASAAALLNAVKKLGGIDKKIHIIEPEVFEPIMRLKTEILQNRNPRLHSDEALIALAVGAAFSEAPKKASACLRLLRGCEAHSTVILAATDQDTYRRLGINITCEPAYQTNRLYHD